MTYPPLLHNLQPDIRYHGDERARIIGQLRARVSFCVQQARFERGCMWRAPSPGLRSEYRRHIAELLVHGRRAGEQLRGLENG